ncbi:hypothetical protein ACRYWZ_26180 [Agrobacterium deltaense]|uniref:hypothetical protein n=1 Tax=Agrobacterium deltaense TaxID=1183412 RepID=UPI003D95245B
MFKRSGGMCEGCGLAEAKQVHHLTYKHVGCEFLFELVAICDGCHERLHQDEAPETGDERANSAEPDNPDYDEPL